MKRIIGDDLRRFDSFLVREPGSCWLWIGTRDRYGYGRFWLSGEIMKAHRASWILHRGPIPDGQWVLHRCDNPPCVNPTHLFLGDRAANMQDMAAKGRQVFQVMPEKVKRGERSHRSKLTDAQAIEILKRLRHGETGASLAREFNISTSTVSALKVGRNWAHLQPQQLEMGVA